MDLNNQILIALPDMQDPRFSQAVILVCEHNKEGAMGLVINSPMDVNTDQIFSDLDLNAPEENYLIFDGGPMNKNCGFILHNNNDVFKSTIEVQDKLHITTSKELLTKISKRQFDCKWQFILGHSSWSKNQLEEEIAQNTWLTCDVDLDLIFNTPTQDKWQKALSLIGISDYKNISGIAHA